MRNWYVERERPFSQSEQGVEDVEGESEESGEGGLRGIGRERTLVN